MVPAKTKLVGRLKLLHVTSAGFREAGQWRSSPLAWLVHSNRLKDRTRATVLRAVCRRLVPPAPVPPRRVLPRFRDRRQVEQ
jgi:hypothetical protein